jgi:hypothetical protein
MFFAIFLKANFIIDLTLMLPLNEVFFGFSHFFAAWGSSLLYILPEAAAAAAAAAGLMRERGN